MSAVRRSITIRGGNRVLLKVLRFAGGGVSLCSLLWRFSLGVKECLEEPLVFLPPEAVGKVREFLRTRGF
ncbi:ABC transporter-related protein [Pyrolobus fumarii 1A]|uniref:ABC transporter-related protein n=1 Tax=Pyrolobus fumarii (strain DSM 11204 / 1A) TaxID=694429 RepID=G0EFL1_PYRF1|nr:ABC transporter-related protein [Pyrolobus fumarii 1A]